jgi:hypothetical protein
MNTNIDNVLINREHQLKLLPIVATIVLLAIFWQWYFSTVDNQWLVQNMIASQAASDNLGEQDIAMLEGIISPSFLKLSTIGGEVVGFLLTLVLLSAYVSLFSRFAMPKDKQLSMSQATNIAAKSSLYLAVLFIPQALYIMFSPENKVDLHSVDFLSLNNLGLMLSAESAFFAIANALSMSTFLFIGLCAYFMHKELNYSLNRAVLVYLMPYLTIWSVMLLTAVI